MEPMKKDQVEKLYEETGIYAWHTNETKQDYSDMTVEFGFPALTDVEDAIKQINEALEGSGLNYQMKTWTMPQEEYLEELE
tara:strand:+ start:3966 stop:4208 length:243 start_codon:yes stop_codon:yes gene_type:complete